MAYKTVSWTPKNQQVLSILSQYTGFNKYPQSFIRQCLADNGIIRVKATQMIPQNNFGSIDLPLKISFYSEDHELLSAAAKEQGIKIQQLLEQVILSTSTTYA